MGRPAPVNAEAVLTALLVAGGLLALDHANDNDPPAKASGLGAVLNALFNKVLSWIMKGYEGGDDGCKQQQAALQRWRDILEKEDKFLHDNGNIVVLARKAYFDMDVVMFNGHVAAHNSECPSHQVDPYP